MTTSLTKCIDLCLNWMLINYAHIYWTQQLAGLDRRSSMEILFIWYLLNSLSFIDLTNICLFDWCFLIRVIDIPLFIWLTFISLFDWCFLIHVIDIDWYDLTFIHLFYAHERVFFKVLCFKLFIYIFTSAKLFPYLFTPVVVFDLKLINDLLNSIFTNVLN